MAFTNDLDLSAATPLLTKPGTTHVPAAAPSLPPAMTSATLSVPTQAAGKLQWKTDIVVYVS
jgi:hypothetical protein